MRVGGIILVLAGVFGILARCFSGHRGGANLQGGGMEPKLSSDVLRGHTDTIVLNILQNGDAYGFEIYNAILNRTGEQYELKETTLYSSYKRLEQEGCISSYWGDETQGARRRYYRITDRGRERYRQNILDWKFTQKILTTLLGAE
jgi:DNA-binding PadR family transcriptional regulator